MELTPEQIARLQEVKDDFERSWRRADDREASTRDIAQAKSDMITSIAYIFGVELEYTR